jgi:hypothetical protein
MFCGKDNDNASKNLYRIIFYLDAEVNENVSPLMQITTFIILSKAYKL